MLSLSLALFFRLPLRPCSIFESGRKTSIHNYYLIIRNYSNGKMFEFKLYIVLHVEMKSIQMFLCQLIHVRTAINFSECSSQPTLIHRFVRRCLQMASILFQCFQSIILQFITFKSNKWENLLKRHNRLSMFVPYLMRPRRRQSAFRDFIFASICATAARRRSCYRIA